MKTAMLIDKIEREFRKKDPSEVRLFDEGADRYQVFTPFTFDDGDYLTILLKHNGTR